MSNEGDRAAVFRTTKVRTKLKGDCSWMQRGDEAGAEHQEEEKPWLAEVRASRLVSAQETSPVSSPTTTTVPSEKAKVERPPSSGYLIRGVFTKTDSKPASTSTSNGFRAPPTVRPATESPAAQSEGQLSLDEQERRTAAASNVLRRSAVRQRSYVFSAAKKYESTENEPDALVVNSSPSFLAKRVEITDDDDSPAPAGAETPAAPFLLPDTSPAAQPQPAQQPTEKRSIEAAAEVKGDELVTSTEEDVTPEPVTEVASSSPVKEDATVVILEDDPFKHMKPGCTKVATPLPVYVLEPMEAVCQDTEPCNAEASEKNDMGHPLRSPSTPVAESVAPVAELPALESLITETPAPEQEPSPSQSSSTETLTISDTLISFDTSATSLLDTQVEDDMPEPTGLVPNSFHIDESSLVKEATSPDFNHKDSVEQEPAPEISNCIVMTDELLSLVDDGPEELDEPVPPSPGRWSLDLLSGPDSLSDPAKATNSLELLADDVIPIITETHSGTEDHPDSWGSQVTTTTTVITSSSADPFDPYPIGTTSPNSSSDLRPPLSAHSINSSDDLVSNTSSPEKEVPNPGISTRTNALEALVKDVIPIDTDTKSLTTQPDYIWETCTATKERQEDVPAGRVDDQQTLITFERKSTENDSPWDRWTSPTVYTVDATTEEEEESPGDTETETVTTITVGETYEDPESATDRPETYSRTPNSEDNQYTETQPETETNKAFVYVKEYLNATEPSLHNGRDSFGSASEYLTSSSSGHSYSAPSDYSRDSLSLPCTYCGELVGSDAKITIEHLNIHCHPACFKCGVCSTPMGDLLYSMFLHGGIVHCENCYKAID